MNRLIAKITIATATTAVSLLHLSPAAFAGEGGVAGAAAFTIDNTNAATTGPEVTGVAVAAAVGKQDAAAAAYNVPDSTLATTVGVQNYAYSLGSAGVISIAAMGDPENAEMTGTDDIIIGTAQGNTFTTNIPGSVQLGTAAGEDLVDFDTTTP